MAGAILIVLFLKSCGSVSLDGGIEPGDMTLEMSRGKRVSKVSSLLRAVWLRFTIPCFWREFVCRSIAYRTHYIVGLVNRRGMPRISSAFHVIWLWLTKPFS